jgi:hypothetical protein
MYASVQDFYNDVDKLIESLRAVGHVQYAENLQDLLHKTAWTTASELLGELRNEFVLLKNNRQLSNELVAVLCQLIRAVDVAQCRV